MKLTNLLLVILLQIPVANAVTPQSIKQESEVTAVMDSKLKGYFTDEGAAELQGTIGYDASAPIEGQGMAIEQSEGLGSAKRQQIYEASKDYQCNKQHCEVGHTFSAKATIARENEIENTGFIKDENGEVRNVKGYLDTALKNVKESKNTIDFLSGEYTDCKPDQETITTMSYDTCDQYFDTKQTGCMAQQIVEIDPQYTYICNKKRDIKEKLCTDVLKNLACKKNGECDAGGIVLSSVDANIGWQYTYPKLLIGTLSIIPDPHMCQIATKVVRFVVKNKAQVQQFKLDNINYSDHIRITLNGVQVLNTISKGNGEYFATAQSGRLAKRGEEFGRVVSGSGYAPACNTKKYYNINPGVDLRSHLKDGLNELKIELAFGNNGQLHVHLMTKQHCCTEWEEEREEQCTFV